jgi:hypothetical protein
MQNTSKHLVWGSLVAVFAVFAFVGCAGDSDERRTAAIGEGEAASLSWQGDWTAEAEYREGSVVTHEGATFVAVTTTTQAPDAKCETDCVWNVMAETGSQTINTQPPPPPKIQVFEYTTGYDGPVELPTLQFLSISDILSGDGLQRWQDAVNAWLREIAPWIIRHRDDQGTIVGEKLLAQGGSYLVFARGVFVSVPGMGKTPTPQGSTPTLGSVISGAMVNGSILGSIGKSIGPLIGNVKNIADAIKGPGVSEYSLACTLRANGEPLDNASMSLKENGTASASLMGFMVVAEGVKFDVACAHNGQKAGPFVRDLRLVAVKLD